MDSNNTGRLDWTVLYCTVLKRMILASPFTMEEDLVETEIAQSLLTSLNFLSAP